MRVLALFGVCCAALAAPGIARADETIALVPGGFRPNSVTVRAGERVIFVNEDRIPRRVLGDNDRFSSPLLRPGESYVHRFDDAASYGFRDSHTARLRGGVLVEPAIQRLTIAASPTRVRGSGIVLLSGRVSNGKAGETVFVLRRFPGEARFNISEQLVTGRGGRWSVRVEAIAGAQFRAQWNRVLSRVVRIGGK